MLVAILFLVLLVVTACYFTLHHLARKRYTPSKLSDYVFDPVNDGALLQGHHASTIMQPASIYISLIAPAYNEEKRVEKFLQETVEYLEKRRSQSDQFTYEIIIVDDGSKDKTRQVVAEFAKQFNASSSSGVIRVLPLVQNRGKGFAVKQGVMRARGSLILMLDSDAATDIKDLDTLERALQGTLKPHTSLLDDKVQGIAVGSRAHMEQGVVRKRKWYRNILMHAFHFFVTTVAGIHSIRDTQCGFKLFTRQSARQCFLNQHIDRWCFDIDILRIALSYFNTPTVEVPVNWQEIEGSKLNLWGMVWMGVDLVLIRMFYLTGVWRVSQTPQVN